MRHIVGMDGGGTKTVICISDLLGNVKDQFYAGAFNLNGQGEQKTRDTLSYIIETLKSKGYNPEECEGLGIGAAGISNCSVSIFLKKEMQINGYHCPVYLYGDHETALAASFPSCHGIILIAGTGSICYGKDRNDNSVRAGGYGHLVDDAGSGYAIARDILIAVVRAEDGRSNDTKLKNLLLEKLGINSMEELMKYLYQEGRTKKEIAGLALLLEKAIFMGDTVALKIEEKSVDELYQLFHAVKRKLPDERNLVFSGSVLINNKRINSMVRDKIMSEYKEMQIVESTIEAAAGALCLLRKEKEGKRL